MEQNDAMNYAMECRLPVEPAALVAMVATTGIDMGLKTGMVVLGVVGGFGGGAVVLGGNSPAGGWFAAATLFAGVLGGVLFLLRQRAGQTRIARGLLDRFGPERYKAAVPVLDRANQFIAEA